MLITALIKTVVYLVKNLCFQKFYEFSKCYSNVKNNNLIMTLTIKQCFYKVIEKKIKKLLSMLLKANVIDYSLTTIPSQKILNF
jgi:hypothetical protein